MRPWQLPTPPAVLLTAACYAPQEEMRADQVAGTVAKIDDVLNATAPTDHTIEKFAGGMMYTVGPVWIKERGPYLLTSKIPAYSIYRWAEGDTEATVFYEHMYRGKPRNGLPGSNGLILDKVGVAAQHR